ncbi:putative peptide chain release factor 1, mitochondrial [Podospora australis]|uniref:Peptide chain release factor 1, mitochondrial n=1 Tax=Podospora australis TaxID=1536484 RepID=A0AAN6X566_9PEZI|nr:putative peptide chain release factor 1, mitochondrial [Podospora australis]
MLATPWICRSCVRSLKRIGFSSQFVRRASTVDSSVNLPPALLERARNLTAEYDELNAKLLNDFDPKIAKRAGEVGKIASAFRQFEKAKASLSELEGLIKSDDAEMREMAREDLADTNKELIESGRNLSVALTPKHPFADMPCVIEIVPGPGGTEGRFFADSVYKMYLSYCANQGFRAKAVQYVTAEGDGSKKGNDGEVALQEATIEVLDEGAYNHFRGEAGMHRVQRVPWTETKGRTHTSAVAVWVLPSFPENASAETEAEWENPESDFYIDASEVKAEKMRASGAGGQHVNKTESAIRLTHIPTGITVSMQDNRSQHANRTAAWKLLRSRIAQKRREEREEQARALRSSVLSQSQLTRSDKIRTYNYSQDRCTDHRPGLDMHNLPDVLRGGETLHKIITSVQTWMTEKDIQALLADEEAAAAVADSKAKKGK